MTLTLTVTSYHRLSPGQEATKVLDRCGVTIGRSPDNDWVLPDPERIVSGRHCYIQYQDGGYYLTDTSANGVFVNQTDQRLGQGQTVKLSDGDELIMGDYEIHVDLSSEVDDSLVEGRRDPYAGLAPDQLENESPLPGVHQDDPFADLAPPRKPKTLDVIPQDMDLLGIESRPVGLDGLGIPPGQKGIPQDADPLGLEGPKSADWWKTTESDHVSPVDEFFQPPEPVKAAPPPQQEVHKSTDDVIPADWEDDLLSPAAPPPSPPPSSPVRQPMPPVEEPPPLVEEGLTERIILPPAAEVPPYPEPFAPEAPIPGGAREHALGPAIPPVTPGVAARVSPAEVHGDHQAAPALDGSKAALTAFLKGAQLPNLPIQEADLPALMTELGAIFRTTVQGLMEVLATRTNIKSEFRLSQTMIQPVENNPLKFSPTPDEAMSLLLMKRGPAFLPPMRAIQEGFNDIKAHQLAVMAGLQGALLNLLRRFDPKTLETRLGEHSLLDNILPGKRKARYWELFTLLYAQIADEAEDDFQELFGREFAKAYEEQIRKL